MFKQFSRYHEKDGVDFSINRLTLAFQDDILETGFKQSYFESNLQLGRACHLIAIFFYCLVGMWDATVIDPSRLSIWIWVIPIVTLIFLLGLISSYVAMDFYAGHWQPLFAFYVLVTGIGFAMATIASTPNYPVYNFMGMIFCLLFCYAFIRLSFIWATAAGNAIVVFYIVGIWRFVKPEFTLLMTELFYLSGISLLGMMVCYSLELMSRQDYILRRLLQNEENKIKNINTRLEQLVAERTKELHEANQELTISIQREKELVARLEREEERLQKSLDSLEQAEAIAKLGYFERNWQTGKAYWSKGFCKLLGYENVIEAMTYDAFLEFIHAEDRVRVTDHFQNAYQKQAPINVEFRISQKNGNVIQVREVADNLYDNDGNHLITKGIFQDITERKQAKEALQKMESRLMQSQKMESIGRLAGGVAHDYNNISSIIIGFAELALEKVAPHTSLYEDLMEILTAAKRSANITRQLLAFARQQTVAPKAIDLNGTIEHMLKMLQRLIGEDLELAWQPGTELWTIKMDPTQIDQILANLCVNARDAITNVGKITIETQNISFDEEYCADHAGFVPGEYVLLAVSDDGSGMARETLEKIFEPFFTTKEQGKGTGLGLATVYGVVKQNNGFISVYSEPEKGTCIKIYIPRHSGQTTEKYKESSTGVPESRGETILMVEDDMSILKLGKKILQSLGYTVLSASKPSEAIRLAEECTDKINLLVTDVVMPEMNGRELSAQLRSRFPGLQTLFMSGYTANVIAHRGVLEDGVCFLSKPFSKKDMAVKVREVLDQDHSRV